MAPEKERKTTSACCSKVTKLFHSAYTEVGLFFFCFPFVFFLDSFLSWITGTHNLKGSFPVYMLFRSWNTSVWQSSDNILGLYFVIPTFCFIYRAPLSIAFLSHFEHNSKDTLPPRTWRHTPPEEFDRFLLLGASSTPSSDRLFLLLVT